MDRVFLDANVLFSAAYDVGGRFLRLWDVADVTLCTSVYALEEARRNIATKGRPDGELRLERLVQRLSVVEGPASMPPGLAVLPEKDQPILAAALKARATHLLTGDSTHFGRYYGRRIAGMLVLRPAEYLARVATGDEAPDP